ncbi:MAG: SpoIID/LytB domain-containing protein [Anaerovibrio sp.]|uniref:SpoIID/LytB domain-containing protein n=1 Tax=Anaerovibrio sp. TaxID=1872532 RepID=UPI0025FCAA5C|nr:SpoIID/LytB domain-containing protein [Anaerovibrio sp.]MCR5176325.1 SpoIID/LytB domain-containing protein [Anaerovibrio sp.]
MIKSCFCKGIVQGLLALFIGTAVLGQGLAEASMLYPGVGKKPATTWKKQDSTVKPEEKKDTDDRASWRKHESEASIIKVGLASGMASASISSVDGMHIYGTSDGRQHGDFRSNIVANLSVEGNSILVNGKNSGVSELLFVPVEKFSGGRIKYNKNEYRGQILVSIVGGKLLIVNKISVEDYIKGVLPSEMSPAWNMEALKAQAVAARTYTFYMKNQKAHLGDGYDLCDSTHCQVYDGLSNESKTTSDAVDATKGMVMTYQGKPIYAPYHASSGGSTENSEDVWGNNLPYLRSVKDDDSKSPYHNWSVRFKAAQVQKLLSAAGKNIGQLKSISMVPVGKSINGVLDSGRASGVKFVGSGQTVVLTGQQVRQIFGLKSTYFVVRTERMAKLPPDNNKKNTSHKNTGTIDAAPAAMTGTKLKVENTSVDIIFDGHGFGHGLGMSQYGAKAMADAGKKYEDILHHYYTDIEIYKMY